MNGRALLGTIAIVGLLNLAARSAGVVKDLGVAYLFGTSDAVDAFLVAAGLQLFVASTLGESFGSAFLPVFVRVRASEGHRAASRSVARASAVILVVLALVALGLAIFIPLLLHVLAASFSDEKLHLTRTLLYLLLPTIPLAGLAALWSAVLNASGRPRLPALLPALAPASTLVLLLVGRDQLGIFALPVGLCVGGVLEATVLARALRRLDVRVLPSFDAMAPAARQLAALSVPLMIGSLLSTSSIVIDQAMAASLGPGAVSTLNYGSKITLLVLAVSILAVGNVLFPEFSRMAANEEWGKLAWAFKKYTWTTIVLGSAVAASLVVLSTDLTRFIFQRGAFSAQDTDAVSLVQVCFAIQIPFHVSGVIGSRIMISIGRNNAIGTIAAVGMVTNVIGNFVLMKLIGVSGIALSTSLVFATTLGLLGWLIHRDLKNRISAGQVIPILPIEPPIAIPKYRGV